MTWSVSDNGQPETRYKPVYVLPVLNSLQFTYMDSCQLNILKYNSEHVLPQKPLVTINGLSSKVICLILLLRVL